MAIPADVKKGIEEKLIKYCEGKAQDHLKGKFRVGYSFKGDSVIIFEERLNLKDSAGRIEVPVAKISYEQETGLWSLSSADAQSRWHKYPGKDPGGEVARLLQEIDKDPSGIFWG